jgi:hypothetical protein
MALESDLEEMKKDCAELVGLTPPADKPKADETPAKEPEKAPEAKAEEKAPEKADEPPPKKDEEEEERRWDKPLQREQQKRAALEKQVAELQTKLEADRKAQAKRDKEWKKLLEVNGVEPEPEEPPPPATPPAAEPPADASTHAEETRMELATAQRERLFAKIERKDPTFDADQAWEQSIGEVLELHGIDPKSTELPEGLTMAALETAAGKVFNHKLTAHQKTPPTAPRKPATTRAGNAGTPKNVSHVPAASLASPDTYDFREECRKLTSSQLEE